MSDWDDTTREATHAPPHLEHEWSCLSTNEQGDVVRWAVELFTDAVPRTEHEREYVLWTKAVADAERARQDAENREERLRQAIRAHADEIERPGRNVRIMEDGYASYFVPSPHEEAAELRQLVDGDQS